MKDVKERVGKVESKIDDLQKVVDARGHKHNENAQAMRDFANTINQLVETNSKFVDKVTHLEKKEAIHDIMIERFDTLGNEILAKMTTVEGTFIKYATKESMIIWVGKFIFQIVSLSSVIAGMLRYAGKL